VGTAAASRGGHSRCLAAAARTRPRVTARRDAQRLGASFSFRFNFLVQVCQSLENSIPLLIRSRAPASLHL